MGGRVVGEVLMHSNDLFIINLVLNDFLDWMLYALTLHIGHILDLFLKNTIVR